MIESLATNPIITSLALTLIHFLWQGVLIALVLKVALSCLSYSRAQLRYASASLAMIANLLFPIFTFIFIYSLDQSQSMAQVQHTPLLGKNLYLENIQATVWYSQWFDYLPLISASWLSIVALLAVKLLVELNNVNRLAKQGTTAVNSTLQTRFNQLVEQINVTRSVTLLLSTKADVPMAIGWIKPVVLIPFSMVSGLTPQQLDMLLLHELAHIRRHDYLVNFLQTLVEILLFFHPLVGWVSKQMRNEREYCSDDIAVKHSGDPIAYAHTLADTASLCQKHRNHSIPTMAMAASGGDLKQRVTRLMKSQQHCGNTNDSGKWLASLTIIIAISISFIQNSLTLSDIDIQSGNISLFRSNSEHSFSSNTLNNTAFKTESKQSPLALQLIAIEENETKNSLVPQELQVNTLKPTVQRTSDPVVSEKPKGISALVNNTQNELPIVVSKRSTYTNEDLTPPTQKNKSADVIVATNNTFAEKAFQRTDSNSKNSVLDNPYSSQVALLSAKPITRNNILNLTEKPIQSFDFDTASITTLKKPLLNNDMAIDTTTHNSKKVDYNSAQLLTSIEPKYPLKAKRKGVELEIMVEFDIDKNGQVKNIQFESKSKVSLFRRTIRNAMEKWRFLPATKNGVAVESKMAKIFSFSLLK